MPLRPAAEWKKAKLFPLEKIETGQQVKQKGELQGNMKKKTYENFMPFRENTTPIMDVINLLPNLRGGFFRKLFSPAVNERKEKTRPAPYCPMYSFQHLPGN